MKLRQLENWEQRVQQANTHAHTCLTQVTPRAPQKKKFTSARSHLILAQTHGPSLSAGTLISAAFVVVVDENKMA